MPISQALSIIYSTSLSCGPAVFTDIELVIAFFCPRKIVVLAKLMFISLFFFMFGFVGGGFQSVYTKSKYSGPKISSFMNHFCLHDMKRVFFVLNMDG